MALEDYQQIAAAVHGERRRHRARRAAARPTTEQRRLPRRSAGSTAATVHLNVVVDPDVIGGMRVEIGDDVIDGTVASRLDDARRRLAG